MRTMRAYIFLALCLPVPTLAQNLTVRIWPNGPPGAKVDANYREETILDRGRPRTYRVTDPELLVYLPAKEKANGTAVVICPGGGYRRLAMDIEGYDIARWFNSMGIAGFILKYRLPSDSVMSDKSVGPLQDVQESMRIVHRRAKEWGIDPNKIGVMGFSAGGHLAGTASTMYERKVYEVKDAVSARPDFSLLIYGVLSMQRDISHPGSLENLLGKDPTTELMNRFSNELQVNPATPPAFIVHAADDKTVPMENSIRYFEALKKNAVPAELHIYEHGGHGFGLAPNGGTESQWPSACIRWLKAHGWM